MNSNDLLLGKLEKIESLLNIVKTNCELKEINNIYYELSYNKRILLSKERCDITNILEITQEKINSLKSSL